LHNVLGFWGENMVEIARGTKVKVLFQGLHMTRVIYMLIYNFKFCILGTSFNIAFHIHIHFDFKLILYHVYYAFIPSIT
jgi:hypothetical protein